MFDTTPAAEFTSGFDDMKDAGTVVLKQQLLGPQETVWVRILPG